MPTHETPPDSNPTQEQQPVPPPIQECDNPEIVEQNQDQRASVAGKISELLRSNNAHVYQDAGQASLNQKTPRSEYDPLQSFKKTHRSKRADYGERPPEPVDRSNHPTTALQEMAAVRSNLRIDAINKREHDIDRFTSLYGDVLFDKEAVREELANSRYTLGEKAAIRKASRHVRRLDKSNERIYSRLDKSAEGKDTAGRTISARNKAANLPLKASSSFSRAAKKIAEKSKNTLKKFKR